MSYGAWKGFFKGFGPNSAWHAVTATDRKDSPGEVIDDQDRNRREFFGAFGHPEMN